MISFCAKYSSGKPAMMLLVLFLLVPPAGHAASISNYRPFSAELYTRDDRLALIALRRYSMNKREYYFAVDPRSLQTEIVPVGRYLILKKPFNEIRQRNKNLAYFKAIMHAEKYSRQLQNAGITRVSGSAHVYLTVDLCPSGLPLDRVLFNRVIAEYGAHHKPVPVAVSITGRWLKMHVGDLKWLIGLESRKNISITWINHSFSHYYRKKVPIWKNFFLYEPNSIDTEILKAESFFIASGIRPSIFFRFPGLVSKRDVFLKVTNCGLVPVGSEAWLGKDQWPKKGGIILVHANGQEPQGIQKFLWLLQAKKRDIMKNEWRLGDLREGICEAAKMY